MGLGCGLVMSGILGMMPRTARLQTRLPMHREQTTLGVTGGLDGHFWNAV